jgi:hypothetical protein
VTLTWGHQEADGVISQAWGQDDREAVEKLEAAGLVMTTAYGANEQTVAGVKDRRVTVTLALRPSPHQGGERTYLGKCTPKGVVLRAVGGWEAPVSYFIAADHEAQRFTGPLKRMPDFTPVTDQEELATVMYFMRKAWK